MSQSPFWKSIGSLDALEQVIQGSKTKPALVFKHRASSPDSIEKKIELENNWNISKEIVDVYIVDDIKDRDVSLEIAELAGIQHEFPQVVLFADGVTMYDESHDMISVKKIKLALKIVNRTFKWMETRA
ncbi:monothiol bacilliredoxin BrxC family protein [Marinoscillum sp.]|uniref:monothiol bacilliredoxin BrxC family protein n=1 Tax=Marinoscillum sp. TaxID=2024838 RepID=UPI003BA8A1D9